MRTRYVDGVLTLPDETVCRTVLEELRAPTDAENVAALQLIIKTLGEVCNKAYDKMLRKAGEDKIAIYQVACEECGAEYRLSLVADDIPEPKHRC